MIFVCRMNEMKKNVLFLLVSILAAAFSGCTESQKAEIPDREQMSTEIVELD